VFLPPAEENTIESHDLAMKIAEVALDKKAAELVVLDVSELISYCDRFVLCNGSNRRQVSAIAQAISTWAKEQEVRPVGVEGLSTGRWVLIDFGSVVVHVFHDDARFFYDLDGLWTDAPRIPVPGVEEETFEGSSSASASA